MSPEEQSLLERRLKAIRIGDIMSRFAITTSLDTSISELAHLMMRFKISGVPILSQDKRIVGIVTATDLFRLLEKVTADIENGFYPTDFCKVSVKDILTRDVFSVSEETTLFEAVKLMCGKNIHTLPVVKGDEIVGIIGRRDVLNSCYSIGTAEKKPED